MLTALVDFVPNHVSFVLASQYLVSRASVYRPGPILLEPCPPRCITESVLEQGDQYAQQVLRDFCRPVSLELAEA